MSVNFQIEENITKKTYIIVTDINSPKRFSKNSWYSAKYKSGCFDSLKGDNFINFHKIRNFISIQTCDRRNLKNYTKGKIERVHFRRGWKRGRGHMLVIFWRRHKWATWKTIITKIYYPQVLSQTLRNTSSGIYLFKVNNCHNNGWNMFKINNNKDKKEVINVVLVSLLFTLNLFGTLLRCFHC